jgi:signal transduction histidine kinase
MVPVTSTSRPSSPYPLAALAVLAAACSLGALGEAIARLRLTQVTSRYALNGLEFSALSLLATLPLALPGATLAAALVCGANLLSLLAFHTVTVGGAAALVVSGYRLGRSGAPAPLPIGLSLLWLVPALIQIQASSAEPAVVTTLASALTAIAALAGATRSHRAESRDTRVQREALTETLLEHTARNERARIARELHDIVAHHVSMVAVQAETARLTTPGLPQEGAERFSAIGDTARAALTEMRRLVGVLRDDEWPDPDPEPARLRPQPGLGQLNELLDEAREASGARTRLVLSGRIEPLDPGVELAAYRIVQEALTNARRHAPGAAVDVELCYAEEDLRIRVRDNGPGLTAGLVAGPATATGLGTGLGAGGGLGTGGGPGSALSGGNGLTGMRERALAVGGACRAGPAPGGGFVVEAALPAKLEEAA